MISNKLVKALHLSLFIVSTYMSVLMFMLIATSLTSKVALALLALIFELTKLTDLHNLQSPTKRKVIYVASYLMKALLSVIASVGLVLTLLAAQSEVADAKYDVHRVELTSLNAEVDYWMDELDHLDVTVEYLNENLSRNPAGFGISGKTFVSQIETIQERKDEYKQNYQEAVENRLMKLSEVSSYTIEINPSNMFSEIGSVMSIDPQKLKMVVFVLIMILIEVSLALTGIESPVEHHTSVTDSKAESPKSRNDIVYQIVRQQVQREQSGRKLMTQTELAERLETTRTTINNVMRRKIKPMMLEKGVGNYCELNACL